MLVIKKLEILKKEKLFSTDYVNNKINIKTKGVLVHSKYIIVKYMMY